MAWPVTAVSPNLIPGTAPGPLHLRNRFLSFPLSSLPTIYIIELSIEKPDSTPFVRFVRPAHTSFGAAVLAAQRSFNENFRDEDIIDGTTLRWNSNMDGESRGWEGETTFRMSGALKEGGLGMVRVVGVPVDGLSRDGAGSAQSTGSKPKKGELLGRKVGW
jgi:hypothetical protein